MREAVTNLKEQLDYENNYYFYHETNKGCGNSICENGLFLSGNNILNVKNLLYTTAIPLTKEITNNEDNFLNFILGESQFYGIRQITEIVILGIPKDSINFIVEPTNNYYKNEDTNNYVINPKFILGFIDLQQENLNLNPDYFEYYDSFVYSKKY